MSSPAPPPNRPIPAAPGGGVSGVSSTAAAPPTKAPPQVPPGAPTAKLPAPPKQRAYAKSSVDVRPKHGAVSVGGPDPGVGKLPPPSVPRTTNPVLSRPSPQGVAVPLGAGPASVSPVGPPPPAPSAYKDASVSSGPRWAPNEAPSAAPPKRPAPAAPLDAPPGSPEGAGNSPLAMRRNTVSSMDPASIGISAPPKFAPPAPPSPNAASTQPIATNTGTANSFSSNIPPPLSSSNIPPPLASSPREPALLPSASNAAAAPITASEITPPPTPANQSPNLRRPPSGGISPAQSPRQQSDVLVNAPTDPSMVRRSSSDEIRAAQSLQATSSTSAGEQSIPVRRTHSATVSTAVRSPSGRRVVVTPRSLASMTDQDFDQSEILNSLPAPVTTKRPPPPIAKSPSISAIPPPISASIPLVPPPLVDNSSGPESSLPAPLAVPLDLSALPPSPVTPDASANPAANSAASTTAAPPPTLSRTPSVSGVAPTRLAGATPAPLAPIMTPPSQRQRAVSALPAVSDADSVEKKRGRIVKELFDTEASYVTSLQTTMDHFVRPLKSAFAEVKKVSADKLEKEKTVLAVTPEAFDELSTLFLTWETILGCHIQFRDALNVPADAGTEAQVGSIVLENTKFIKLYRHYVNSYDKILAAITTCTKNPAFARFVDGLMKKPEFKGLTLYAYLIMPVQRVPRYVLLLSDLLKNTPESNSDHEPIKTALELIKAFADFINTNKAAAENREKLDLLRSRITDTDGADLEALVKGRRVIKHGELKVKSIVHNGEKDGESFEAFAFLTDDQLILAKIQKRGDQPKSKLRLVIKVHGSVTLENDKEISFAAASGDKYTFKSAEGNPSDLADWKAHIEAQAKESIARLMRNEDHLFAIVETDAHDSAISEEDRKKKQYLARQKVASEIVEKEQDYTKKLGVLADWIGRLRASNNRDLISAEEIVLCFSNIEAIANAHRDIFSLLTPKMDNWNNDSTIADVYREKLDYFKLYRPYALTYPTLAPNFSQQQAKHPLFIMMVAEFEKNHKSECGTIESIFTLPLRRVESLNALMKELLRNTPKEHADFGHLVWVTKTLNEREEELKKVATPEPVGRTRSATVNSTTKDKKKK